MYNDEHIIAANVDQILLVASVRRPPFKRNLVDRFLLLARQTDLTPILVIDKCDLEDELRFAPGSRRWSYLACRWC